MFEEAIDFTAKSFAVYNVNNMVNCYRVNSLMMFPYRVVNL